MESRCWRWLIACCAFGTLLPARQVDAILFVIGDQHSAYARSAQLVAQVDRVKASNPGVPVAILIDGDSFEQGNVVARRSEGAADLALFAALARRGPTIINLGNHEPEFHDVPETVKRVGATGVTVIGNLADRSTGSLFAPASTRLSLGRAELVVAGVTTDILAQYRAAIRPTLDLSAPATWAREKFPELLAAAPLRIVLSHAGLRLDRGMFPFIPEGALIAGAHDHAQFVERMGQTVYFHSGSWNSHVSIVRLQLSAEGPTWTVEQQAIRDADPADAELAAVITEIQRTHLTAADLVVVGQLPGALTRDDSARYVVRAVRRATNADAAFIGNTTFGDALPAGDVTQVDLNSCVRFDGTLWTAELTGTRLRKLMSRANQGPDTPFAERDGEFSFADGPLNIVADRMYRIATNDWGVQNRSRYFSATGADEISFTEIPTLRLKAVTAAALAAETPSAP